MKLEVGQIINDGDNDLIVSALKEHEGSLYAYVMNINTDEVGFYKVIDLGEEYDFKLVEDDKTINELFLMFAKDYATKNPEAFDRIKKSIDEQNGNI